MGSEQSIVQKNMQKIKNDIVQKSSQHCVFTCNKSGGSSIIDIEGSTINR